MFPPYLRQELEKHEKFKFLKDKPGPSDKYLINNGQIKKVNDVISGDLFERHKKILTQYKANSVSASALSAALKDTTVEDDDNSNRTIPLAWKALAIFLILSEYEKDEDRFKYDFENQFEIRYKDLISTNPNLCNVSLRNLHGGWLCYIRFKNEVKELPMVLKYNGFEKPLDLYVKYTNNNVLSGTAISHFSTLGRKDLYDATSIVNTIPRNEIWLMASDDTNSMQARLHLSKDHIKADLLLNGSATINITPIKSPRIINTAIVLLKTEDEPIVDQAEVQTYGFPDEPKKQDSPKGLIAQEIRPILIYLFRRKPFESPSYTPNNIKGLEKINERPFETKGPRLINPLSHQVYTDLTNKLGEDFKFYSYARLSANSDKVSVYQWDITPNQTRRQFVITRQGDVGKSDFKGVVDFCSDDLHMILRESTNSRNRYLVIDFPNSTSDDISVMRSIGLSTHGKETIGFRELFIRIKKHSEADKSWSIDRGNIDYSQFLEIPEDFVSTADKLYLADRNQSTLTFPTRDNHLFTYNAQKDALDYAGREYFIYSPYAYGSDYDFIRTHLVIDKVGQSKLTLTYPWDTEKNYVFFGKILRNNNTLRLQLATEDGSPLHIFLNVKTKAPSPPIALHGWLMGTDFGNNAFSESCFMIDSKALGHDFKGLRAGAVPKDYLPPESNDNESEKAKKKKSERYKVESILSTVFSDSLKFTTLDDHFGQYHSHRYE